MSTDATVGIYNGQPADPDAEARKMFTEWKNQQDGLAAILTYCQRKVGFHAGSTDTGPLRHFLADEFSGIIIPRTGEHSLPKNFEKSYPLDTLPPDEELKPYFPVEHVYEHFIASVLANYYRMSLALLFVGAHTDLTLNITEIHVVQIGNHHARRVNYTPLIVDRNEMARRADELMDKLKLRESIGDWAKKITSNGW